MELSHDSIDLLVGSSHVCAVTQGLYGVCVLKTLRELSVIQHY